MKKWWLLPLGLQLFHILGYEASHLITDLILSFLHLCLRPFKASIKRLSSFRSQLKPSFIREGFGDLSVLVGFPLLCIVIKLHSFTHLFHL